MTLLLIGGGFHCWFSLSIVPILTLFTSLINLVLKILKSYHMVEHLISCFSQSVPAKIDGSENIAKPEVIINDTITLFCPATGIPIPDIVWYINEDPITLNTSRLTILDSGYKLEIRQSNMDDTGRYSCRAKNIAGDSEKYFDLSVLGNVKFLYIHVCMFFLLQINLFQGNPKVTQWCLIVHWSLQST